jgi:hypothetical protein
MDVEQAALRFERSRMVRELWPPRLRESTRALFAPQRLINAVTSLPPRWPGLEELRDLLNDSSLRTLPLLVAGSSPVLQEIGGRAWARGARSPALETQMAIGALARRDYLAAAEHFAAADAAAQPAEPGATNARMYLAFALLMAERTSQARVVLTKIGAAPAASPDVQQGLRWLRAMLPDL